MGIDTMIILVLIPFLLVLLAQIILKITYRKYESIETDTGLTGMEVSNKILLEMGIVSEGEHDGTKAMLKAAAFTYVAGLVSAIASTIFQVLRLIYIFGGRDND